MKGKLPILLLILIFGIVYWQWWLPGPRVATDFSFISNPSLKSLLDFPRLWSEKGSEGLGEYTVFTLWAWPLSFLAGLLANVGLSFAFQERILLLIPFLVMGVWGIWKMGESLKFSSCAKFISSFFYISNTYVLLLIDGGQIAIGLAYGWFPVCYLAIEKAVGGRLTQKLLAGLKVAVLGFFDIRFIYILFLLSLARFLYEFFYLDRQKWISWILRWFRTGLVIGLVTLLLNSYWLLPLIKVPLAPGTYVYLTQTSFLNFASLGHSMLVLSPHWFKNIFGNLTLLHWEFILIPILAFLAPILRPKNTQVGFWLLIALLSIFFTKGAADPFPNIYPWLFSNIPGFSLFRDSSKFFFLVALSYAVLIGVTIDEILQRISKFPKLQSALVLLMSCYLLLLIRPVWLGMMTGTFSNPPLQREYQRLSQILANDKNFSRVFWIPTITPLGYSDPTHPILEASRLIQKRPFMMGVKGTYETFNFIREAPYTGELFDVAGVGFIAYPYLDTRRDNNHDNIRYYYTFLKQILALPWVEGQIHESPIPLIKTKNHQDKFFITDNSWWVIGADDIYKETTKSANLKLSKNSLVFAEEYPGLTKQLDRFSMAKIILNKKSLVDLAANFIEPEKIIFPARYLSLQPDKSGWWKRESGDLIKWRDFLQTKYGLDNQDFDLGGGWAVGEGNLKFKIKNLKLKRGEVLLARVLESSRSGQLQFYQDDQFIGKIDTKKESSNIHWFEVGQLKNSLPELVIGSDGDINVVNAVASLDSEEWEKYKKKAKELEKRVVSFKEGNSSVETSYLSYKQIDPTKYKVKIWNLNSPKLLVFSQVYDPRWKMNGQNSVPVYSLLNGFKVEKDGEYLIEFEPQKYVFPGLVVSGLTGLVIISWLLFHKVKED